MVRDPDRYTPMRNIPEFEAAGVSRVQGGTFPARIWGAYMEQIGLEPQPEMVIAPRSNPYIFYDQDEDE